MANTQKKQGLFLSSNYIEVAMSTAEKKHVYLLPERYRQAQDVIEAAGGTVSEFMLDLVVKAEHKGLSDKEVIQALKDHYQAHEF
jgi:hypothetical protein